MYVSVKEVQLMVLLSYALNQIVTITVEFSLQ